VTGGRIKLHNKERTILDVQITENDIGKACSTHVIDEKCLKNFVLETRREETAWKYVVLMD
jgi:hypothetical protein